jgi:hypothetical protein
MLPQSKFGNLAPNIRKLRDPADQVSTAGYFVRISHDEVSVSHPDAIRKILLDPLRKVR